MVDVLDGWVLGQYTEPTAPVPTHPTYRRGSGPGVVVIAEIPGITPEVVAFADEVVAQGFTVVMPHLFGEVPSASGAGAAVRTLAKVCVNREFTKLRLRETSPVATWLRSLARTLHAELGGPGVGALGMCFTGGFALAMMVDESVAAPVLAQPSLPFPIGRARGADLNLSPADLDVVKRRAAAGCAVLGLRYADDPATGTRFDTLTGEIGDAFLRVELPGRKHSTVTGDRQPEFVDAVMSFFRDTLLVEDDRPGL
ncbi:Dienelactone hydrolase family protein [Microlunatus sagamiharensis]|uniref:Dienelactone hydrolase family protein n=1 Tax=Microlunatus sagamiharensis TaxID=546874 RepID=A0A1H2NCT2_9ACTN|nr:dienelactone hydrolase family protein [Microlunatus sagamiharensis]SDV02961.1 Dienelactone hydrolase family protein [Microlunatus sagamiharensis]